MTNTSSLSVARDGSAACSIPSGSSGCTSSTRWRCSRSSSSCGRRPPTTQTLATAWDVTTKLGKRGVLVRDAPAFVVNRLLTRQSSVLMQALETGSTFEETDEAALRLGIPMPPSALLAMVGPRVANHVLHTLHEAFPDRFPLSPTLENFANGEMDIVLTDGDPADRRRDPRGDPGGARRRGTARPRRRRRRRPQARSTPA